MPGIVIYGALSLLPLYCMTPLSISAMRVHNKEILDHLPEGAFVTVSNHPIGSLDGIMLIDIFASRRPDFKVMVNGILTKIGAMEDNFHIRGARFPQARGESGECQWRATIPATPERRSSDGVSSLLERSHFIIKKRNRYGIYRGRIA